MHVCDNIKMGPGGLVVLSETCLRSGTCVHVSAC